MFARWLAVPALLCSISSIVLAGEDSVQSSRQLAAAVERAIASYDAAHPPSAAELTRLDRQALLLRRSIRASDVAASRKLDTADLLLAQLHDRVMHARSSAARTNARAHVEVVTAEHGAACTNALGIDAAHAVQVTLPQSGIAWLRVSSPSSLKVETQSSGADPALELYRGCGAASHLIARDDDSGSLDARVAVKNPDRSDLFIRLTNAGDGGPIVVDVVTDTITAVTGKVIDKVTGLPVANATIELACSTFFADFCGSQANSDANGNYEIDDAAGSYYVRVDASGYVSELYPHATCVGLGEPFATSGCDVSSAEYFTFAAGTTTPNVNFSLDTGHKISGQVRDANNQPLVSANVAFEDSSGSTLAIAYTDSGGHYSQSTLPPANYIVIAADDGYASQMYQNKTCGGPSFDQCNIAQATPVTLGAADITGVDFDLPHLATVTGTVLGDDNQPLPTITPSVEAVDTLGNVVRIVGADENGQFELGPLPLGTYFLIAADQGYFSELYNGVTCGANCLDSGASATTITLTQVGQVSTANFHLHALPVVLGHVTDTVTALPIANVSIAASPTPPSQFAFVSSALTDQNGNYTLQNVPPGTYYLWARSDNHVDAVYPNLACEAPAFYSADCSVSGAILLTIADGVTPPTFNFSLDPSASLQGTMVVNAGPGSDLVPDAYVSLYDTAGVLFNTGLPDATGHYVINDLPPGTYFAQSSNYEYVQQTWQAIDCTQSCAATLGTPISINTGDTVSGIDFNLVQLDAFVGRLTNADGLPIGGAIVDLFDTSSGSWAAQGIADSQGYYAASGAFSVLYDLVT